MEKLDEGLLEKLRAWCSSQERCASELRRKLKRYGADPEQVSRYQQLLVDEKYIDERKFAEAFVQGKSRIKHWGPMKIRSGLRMKGIPSNMIDELLKDLDTEEMAETIDQLLVRKWPTIRAKDAYDKKQKSIRFLAAKGYKVSMAYTALERLEKSLED